MHLLPSRSRFDGVSVDSWLLLLSQYISPFTHKARLSSMKGGHCQISGAFFVIHQIIHPHFLLIRSHSSSSEFPKHSIPQALGRSNALSPEKKDPRCGSLRTLIGGGVGHVYLAWLLSPSSFPPHRSHRSQKKPRTLRSPSVP